MVSRLMLLLFLLFYGNHFNDMVFLSINKRNKNANMRVRIEKVGECVHALAIYALGVGCSLNVPASHSWVLRRNFSSALKANF